MNEETLHNIGSNTSLNGIATKEFANNDNSWYPYSYRVIRCCVCKKDSGYRIVKWFGYFTWCELASYIEDRDLICNSCRIEEENLIRREQHF